MFGNISVPIIIRSPKLNSPASPIWQVNSAFYLKPNLSVKFNYYLLFDIGIYFDIVFHNVKIYRIKTSISLISNSSSCSIAVVADATLP